MITGVTTATTAATHALQSGARPLGRETEEPKPFSLPRAERCPASLRAAHATRGAGIAPRLRQGAPRLRPSGGSARHPRGWGGGGTPQQPHRGRGTDSLAAIRRENTAGLSHLLLSRAQPHGGSSSQQPRPLRFFLPLPPPAALTPPPALPASSHRRRRRQFEGKSGCVTSSPARRRFA